jgi:hypothetical protein
VVIKFHRILLRLNTTPYLRELTMLRVFFLIAQPPLLGEEGKLAAPTFGQHARQPVAATFVRKKRIAEGVPLSYCDDWSSRFGSPK